MCTVIMGVFFIFFPPPVLFLVVLVAFAVTFGARSLPPSSLNDKRTRLLFVVVPVIFLLLANVLAFVFGSNQTCRLGSWA